MSKEAMKLALDALIAATPVKAKDPYMQAAAIVALEEALTNLAEQPAPVSGVVLREGQPTLLRDRDIKTTDVRLCVIKDNQS